MQTKKNRILSCCLIAVLLSSQIAPAQTPAAPSPGSTQGAGQEEPIDVEPKFIWGILIKFIAGQVFSAFAGWVGEKITEGATSALTAGGQALIGGGISLAAIAIKKLRAKKDTRGGAFVARNATSEPVGSKDATAVSMGRPNTPLSVGGQGTPNYQGVNIAVVGIGSDNEVESFRAIKEGFRTGQRFKLHVLATYGGPLVIENINPKGERRQIYPPEKDSVVMLQAGAETLLPLGKDEFFQFTNVTGDEQLVITLRDPRAVGAAASKTTVYRKDEDYGSNFVQEVTATTFPTISESIHLQHN